MSVPYIWGIYGQVYIAYQIYQIIFAFETSLVNCFLNGREDNCQDKFTSTPLGFVAVLSPGRWKGSRLEQGRENLQIMLIGRFCIFLLIQNRELLFASSVGQAAHVKIKLGDDCVPERGRKLNVMMNFLK
jgi:hypothetical protein